MSNETLKKPPTVGHDIKGSDFPEPPRTPKPPPTSDAVTDNGSPLILDHIATFLSGAIFGIVLGAGLVFIGRLA